jgi:lipoprotein NlpD
MNASRIFGIMFLFVATSSFAENAHYIVAEKDTLWSIAQRYNVGVDEIMEVNGIEDEKNLRVGMRLTIPSIYIVKKGDNLWRIAQNHHTSVQVLRDLNGMTNDEIHAGDKIVVPGIVSTESAAELNDDAAVESVKDDQAVVSTIRREMDSVPFWPLEGVRTRKTGKISGTEILGSQGDTVVSIAAGEVVWNSTSPVFGNVIIIESPGNYLYLYSGLTGTVVKFGERISAGTKITELGVNPHTGEAKLLFSVYKDGKLVDPSVAPRG